MFEGPLKAPFGGWGVSQRHAAALRGVWWRDQTNSPARATAGAARTQPQCLSLATSRESAIAALARVVTLWTPPFESVTTKNRRAFKDLSDLVDRKAGIRCVTSAGPVPRGGHILKQSSDAPRRAFAPLRPPPSCLTRAATRLSCIPLQTARTHTPPPKSRNTGSRAAIRTK